MAFPSSPTLNQIVTEAGRSYIWTGTVWNLNSVVAGHAATHAVGGGDQITVAASQVSDLATAARSAVGAYGKTLLFG